MPVLLVALMPTGCMLFVGAVVGGAAVGAAAASAATDGRNAGAARGAGPAVAVTLSPARDVAAVGGVPADTTWVRGAVSLIGRVVETRGDTLRLALTEGRGPAGVATFPSGWEPRVDIVQGAGVQVRVISRAPAQTDGAFVGAFLASAAVTAGLFLALLVYCSNRRCLD